ncbi:hypothetical protein, partial [Bradyrhizobium sp.]|uniref:hypothetical protein n=1 Tax=Bradyrhizobium sp. TaxID=376 RepID=UPI003C2630CB
FVLIFRLVHLFSGCFKLDRSHVARMLAAFYPKTDNVSWSKSGQRTVPIYPRTTPTLNRDGALSRGVRKHIHR